MARPLRILSRAPRVRAGLILACLLTWSCAATEAGDGTVASGPNFQEPIVSDGGLPDGDPQRADADAVDAGDSVTDASEREVDQGVNTDAAPIDCGNLTQCGGGCADLENDVNNCGACGYTCALFNAESACIAGSCAVDACLDFEDSDGDPDNGCEFENLPKMVPVTPRATGLTQCEGSIAMCVLPERVVTPGTMTA